MTDKELIEYLSQQAKMLSKQEGESAVGATQILYAMCGALQAGTFPELVTNVHRFVQAEIGRMTN